MENILITGANGQLGSEIFNSVKNNNSDLKKFNFIFTDIAELDLTNIEKLNKYFSLNKIDYIVNCAAYTAVDKSESDIYNAEKINIYSVKSLAEISKKQNIKLIHISTDYVFDGKSCNPYKEDSKTNPQGVYGKTKLKGENEIISCQVTSIILRTSWLYSFYGQNFVKTIQKLAKEKSSLNIIYDQIGTPTYARDLAEIILLIITEKQNVFGPNEIKIYNYSNEGVASWYDFAKAIVEFSELKCEINPIETKDYPTPAKRPHYSVLDKGKIKKELNIKIPYWRDSLKECVRREK
ncbi:MAG: dTDP-4-dehydrorhamnose reductase [Candidatus Firestonebacteria bacterium]|nr:dTDP-4-dehydrorhamnose reductase [Candidatus Firestonebacteria bacterium]